MRQRTTFINTCGAHVLCDTALTRSFHGASIQHTAMPAVRACLAGPYLGVGQ